MVAFRPRRLAFHLLIVQVATNLAFARETEFHDAVRNIYYGSEFLRMFFTLSGEFDKHRDTTLKKLEVLGIVGQDEIQEAVKSSLVALQQKSGQLRMDGKK